MNQKQIQIEMWLKTINWLLDLLKKQGLSFALLAVAVYYLNKQVEQVDKKYTECNSQMIQMYETISIHNQKVIDRNTMIMERIEKKLD